PFPLRRETPWGARGPNRTLPQPQATATTAEASAADRRREPEAARPTVARPAAATSIGRVEGRARFASAKPRQSAPTNACGRRIVTSRDHESLQLRHVRRPDAG